MNPRTEGRGGDPISLVVVLVFFFGPFVLLAGEGAALGAWVRDRSQSRLRFADTRH